MKLASMSARVPAAIAVLLITVGTVFAAAPSGHPSHPPKGTDAAQTESADSDAPETEAPETETPETEAPETEAPETEAPDTQAPASPDTGGVAAANLDRIVALLADAGITTTADELKALADQVGVGGAVRVLEFAKDNTGGKTSADILAMFQAGEGWGRIRKDLGLTGSSGIGRIMGGHGKGHSKH